MSIGFKNTRPSRGDFDFGRGDAERAESQEKVVLSPADLARQGAAQPPRPRRAPSSSVLPALMEDDLRTTRRKRAVLAGILALLLGVSLCFTASDPAVVSPIEVVQIYALHISNLWFAAFDPSQVISGIELVEAHPTYFWTLTSFVVTLAYALCGCMLALAGMLYQNVFRNPIASPSMLGVASGIQLGVAVLVIMFSTSAGAMMGLRYVFSFAAVALVLVALFGFSWLMSGKGRSINVTNMLVAGVILNQVIGVVVTYLTWFYFDEEEYDVFTALTTMVQIDNSSLTWGVLLASFALAVVPVVALRFRMNALNFSPAEMRMFGVNATGLQLATLVLGTIVMVCAQLEVGMVAMITLVVPHIARGVFGSEFRKQLSGTLLIGAAVLVLCHIVAIAIPYQGEIPLGVVVNLVLLPAFVWIMATQQERWD